MKRLSTIHEMILKRPEGGPPFAFAMVWLVYLLFPITEVADKAPVEQWVGFPLIVAFAASHIVGFVREQWRLACIVAQLFIIGYFIWRYHESFVYMGFYTASLLGMLSTTRQIGIALSGMFMLFGFDVWRYEMTRTMDDFLGLLPAVLAMLLLPVAMLIGRRSRRLRMQLRLANDEIERLSKSEERQRISRELHDTLGHTLTMITLKSELAEKMIDAKPERAKQEIRDVQATSRAALKQVRDLVTDMSAVTILEELPNAKRILAAASIGVKLQGDFDSIALSPLLDNLLGMCMREAVTNVVKHSRARLCTIAWAEEPARYVLTVADDGVGLAGRDEQGILPAHGHNGLRGMQERLNLVDGLLRLTPNSPQGQGARLTITVPKVNAASSGRM
ncbi:sensor histidine kinase [Cohnella sp. GCM10027633]|uniref:sensor histidine kinase n=1 Tax=unclassified Cohnella TaxID=2636738 RepID=UPI00363F8DDE